MSESRTPAPRGDQVRVTLAVAVPQDVAFEIFTSEIDRWWRKGPRFRQTGMSAGMIRLEAGVGGRLFESVESAGIERIFVVGHVRAWEPPSRLVFTWKNQVFAADEGVRCRRGHRSRSDLRCHEDGHARHGGASGMGEPSSRSSCTALDAGRRVHP
jgi:uncharacterized protein YndB with AHSA1/START domain